MRKISKIAGLLLLAFAFVFILGDSTTVKAEMYKGSCGENVNWTLDTKTGVLNITGNGPMNDWGVGKGNPSWYTYEFHTVIIEDGVTRIGNDAFSSNKLSTKLSNIIMPDSITEIGKNAFKGLKMLNDIKLSKNITIIGSSAFASCYNLKGITLPENLKTIGWQAFYLCQSMEYIHIPNEVTSIGGMAFSGCSSLKRVEISSSSLKDLDGGFSECTSLESVILPEGLETIGQETFRSCENLISINFPKTLRSIGYRAFYRCNKLKGIVLPYGLESIDQYAFAYTSLEHIIIPKSVNLIAAFVFQGCTNIKKIAFMNSETEINVFNNGNPGVTTYYGYKDSTAHKVAIVEGFAFEVITEDNLWEDKMEYPNPFTDVPESEFFCDPVKWAVYEGITTGLTETAFGPNNSCTRGQVVTFLWRALGKPSVSNTKTSFKDIKAGEYYYDAVLWAVQEGITNGTSNTTFEPDFPCSRGQIVTFLWRALEEPKPSSSKHTFTDISSKEYYYNPVLWAVENKVTTGLSTNKFGPDSPCTRGQIVTFLYRAFGA